jgi:tetratricopeptide (TPR) repeat protein
MLSWELLQQASAALQQGRLDEAEGLCAQVLEATPRDAFAHYLMAVGQAALQRNDDALAHYDAALAVNPAMAEAWNNRGSLLWGMGRLEAALETPEQYHVLAVSLARDPAALKALKDRLAANRGTMPLFDAAHFTRNIERAYVRMMETLRQGGGPHSFRVE